MKGKDIYSVAGQKLIYAGMLMFLFLDQLLHWMGKVTIHKCIAIIFPQNSTNSAFFWIIRAPGQLRALLYFVHHIQ